MDGLHAQLVGDQLADVRHREVVRRVRGRARAEAIGFGLSLGAVVLADAVAVVAVGDEHRLPATAALMARHRAASSIRSTVCVTPSSSTTAPNGSPGGRRRSVSPLANDRPQIGERLARVARVRSSRSVLAFGVVRSWGSTPFAGPWLWPGSTTSSAPTTPTVSRARPASSVKAIR